MKKKTNKRLYPQFQHLLDAPYAEREDHIDKLHPLSYPTYDQILEELQALLRHPKVHRMPCILLVAPPNNGKTTILRKFRREHPPVIDSEHETRIAPVVFVEADPDALEMSLYRSILEDIGNPCPDLLTPKYTRDEAKDRVRAQLLATQTRVLTVDEIHEVFKARKDVWERFMARLKWVSNKVQIPIVAAGTEEAYHLISSDDQLMSRFRVIRLPRWTDDQDYRNLLAGFEATLPLRYASHLDEDDLAGKLMELSDGLIGEMHKLLKIAAKKAILGGTEQITTNLLDEILRAGDYEPPSQWGYGGEDGL